MVESYSLKAPNFLCNLYIFILQILDIYYIFFAIKNRTIAYFNENQSYFSVPDVPGSNPA